jgi:hypothetical protein
VDGQRPPTSDERVDGLLANTPVGLYAHFMHRDDARAASSFILDAESQADRLAFELIAPERNVWASTPKDLPDRTSGRRVLGLQRLLIRFN